MPPAGSFGQNTYSCLKKKKLGGFWGMKYSIGELFFCPEGKGWQRRIPSVEEKRGQREHWVEILPLGSDEERFKPCSVTMRYLGEDKRSFPIKVTFRDSCLWRATRRDFCPRRLRRYMVPLWGRWKRIQLLWKQEEKESSCFLRERWCDSLLVTHYLYD